MSRNATIRRLLADAPSTPHEIAALSGLSLRSVQIGIFVLCQQKHAVKTGGTLPSELGNKPRNLYRLTDRGRRFAAGDEARVMGGFSYGSK